MKQSLLLYSKITHLKYGEQKCHVLLFAFGSMFQGAKVPPMVLSLQSESTWERKFQLPQLQWFFCCIRNFNVMNFTDGWTMANGFNRTRSASAWQRNLAFFRRMSVSYHFCYILGLLFGTDCDCLNPAYNRSTCGVAHIFCWIGMFLTGLFVLEVVWAYSIIRFWQPDFPMYFVLSVHLPNPQISGMRIFGLGRKGKQYKRWVTYTRTTSFVHSMNVAHFFLPPL